MDLGHFIQLHWANSSNQWLMNIDNGKINSVILLDIRKAFDTVDHGILIQNSAVVGLKVILLRFLSLT